MSYFERLTTIERTLATFLYETPELVSIPNVLSEERFGEIATFKGYADVESDKKEMAHRFISGIIYRATGLFFDKLSLSLRYDAGVGANVLPFPFRCVEVNRVIYAGNELQSTEWSVEKDSVSLSRYVTGRDVYVEGKFGYDANEGVPNDVELAVSILLEDYLIGDKYDRMQSASKSITLDKLSFDLINSSYGSVTGNIEVDRLLTPHALPYSAIAQKTSPRFKLAAL